MARKVNFPGTKMKVDPWVPLATIGTGIALIGLAGLTRKKGPSADEETAAAQGSTVIVVEGGIQQPINLYDQANGIYTALGLHASWWNPRGWWEDEEKAMRIVLDTPTAIIPDLERMYSQLYDRVMRNDLQTYLSDGEWALIRHKFI